MLLMYDEFDDLGYDDSLMEEVDNLLYDEEYEKVAYDRKCSEINEYWNRENEYIKKSGIYTKEEVRQILDEHNRIRREKLAEAKKDYEMALGIVRGEKQMAAEDRRMEREELEFERQFANEDIVDDDNNMAYHAYREELAAYADFIASMDMADD